MTETDTTNPADGTDYEYTYDADGNMLTSRMAPGDLRSRGDRDRTPRYADTSSSHDRLEQRSFRGSLLPLFGFSLTAGEVVTVALTSSAFHPVAFVQPPGGNPANWLIDQNGLGNGNAWLMFTVGTGQAGTWLIGATSSFGNGQRRLQPDHNRRHPPHGSRPR